MTLNDPTFVECSQAFAKQLQTVSEDLEPRLRYGFLAVTTREATKPEVEALSDLYQQCRLEKTSEIDALTAVASVLLNLDEIMSK